MDSKKSSKSGRFRALVAGFLVFLSLFIGVGTGFFANSDVYAVPENGTTATEETTNEEATNKEATSEETKETTANNEETKETTQKTSTSDNGCKNSLGSLGWLVCPVTNKVAEAVDFLYEQIENVLALQPIESKDGSPVYEIWKYCLGVTNVVFIIFLLVVIYSQITGFGISNYGIKKSLPKLIVAAIIVNMSFLICLLAVDVSNIIGNSLRGVFTNVEETVLAASSASASTTTYSGVYSALAGGASLLAIGGGVIAFETGAIWMLIPVVLGALVAVASGLITIALRQAVVILLVMISPLAMVAYMLPNTEKWFKKWKELFMRMLVFYPMFSLLFGASSLAGFAIMMSASSGFGVLLGMAVQIFPLFFCWKLMQMSGTILGDINSKMRGMAARPLAGNRRWADSKRTSSKLSHLASERPITPSLRLMQFMSNKSIARSEKDKEHMSTIQARGAAYAAGRNYRVDKNGKKVMSRVGERSYNDQARRMQYQSVVDYHNVNFNEGLSDYYAGNAKQKARLEKLDKKNMDMADRLSMVKIRSDSVEYSNAMGRSQRMQDAINAHTDLKNGFEYKTDGAGNFVLDANGNKIKVARSDYKFHFDPNNIEQSAAMARYNTMHQIMHNDDVDTLFVAAASSYAYETQQKMRDSKFQIYYDRTVPTKDLDYQLSEITKKSNSSDYMDSVIPGLRILNKRGDIKVMRKQMENMFDSENGIELGTHASQSLANFLMFEVKDSDPFLRRMGKCMNVETAKIYNKNERQNTKFTMKEYVTGEYEDWDANDPTKKFMGKVKKPLVDAIEGTSLDGVERETYESLDETLINAYTKNGRLDVDGYLKKRREVETAMGPAFISASLKYPSGSEPLKNAVSFLLGYDGGMMARWEDPSNPLYGNEDAENYFRSNAVGYIKNQTPAQILAMRSDYRDAMMEHLVEQYFIDNASDKTAMEQRKTINDRRAEIAERNMSIANEKDRVKQNKKDEHKDEVISGVKKEIVGKEMRKILGETGKLAQIYKTKKAGSANNAKDWLREWVGLDNEELLAREVEKYDRARKSKSETREEAADSNGAGYRIYDEVMQTEFLAEIDDAYDDHGDDVEEFYSETYEKMVEWFSSEDYLVKSYEKYKSKNSNITSGELLEWLRDKLGDLNNYPG